MKRNKKAIIAFALCLIVAISCCAAAFAAETRWVVDCPECKRGTIIEHSWTEPYTKTYACAHFDYGSDIETYEIVTAYQECNNCDYETEPITVFRLISLECHGYNA